VTLCAENAFYLAGGRDVSVTSLFCFHEGCHAL